MTARTLLLLAVCVFLFPVIAPAAEVEPQVILGDDFQFVDVDADGETVVVISRVASGSMALEFYTRDAEGIWSVQQTLAPVEGGSFNRLQLEGDVLVAGRDTEVFVFERNAASGLWRQVATLTPTNVEEGGAIVSIATDGARIAIAEAYAVEEISGPDGVVHYFVRDMATLAWERLATFEVGRRPVSTDISGQRVVVADERGLVQTLEYNGTELLNEFLYAGVTDSGSAIQVRLEGDVMAAASPGDSLPNYPPWQIGQVYVFEVEGDSRIWGDVARFTSMRPEHASRFGSDMEMNDGIIAAVEGSEGDSRASLMRKNEAGTWVRFATPDCGCGTANNASAVVSVSANALALVSSYYSNRLLIYDMTALMSTPADDEPGNTDDGGDDEPQDDGGNGGDNTGDDSGGALGDGDGGDAGSDVGEDAGGDTGSDTGGDGDGDGDGNSGGDAGGGETGGTAGSETVPSDDGGGGAFAWLLVLALLLARVRRAR